MNQREQDKPVLNQEDTGGQSNGHYQAAMTRSTNTVQGAEQVSGLQVSTFMPAQRSTPGNVGVCLGGGGSRALVAGMGQLRALSYLQLNGVSLLEQTKALSSVSGGSWLAVPFQFLPDSYNLEDFLNRYVADPGDLVPTHKGASKPWEILDELPPTNIGNCIDSDFSLPAILLKGFWLWWFKHTKADMLWQTVMALHLLEPYQLYTAGHSQSPTTTFSYDGNSVADLRQLKGQTADFEDLQFNLQAPNRPYYICNTSLFVKNALPVIEKTGDDYPYLVPIQCTPFFCGALGIPSGTDANDVAPGGGGVSAFAFSSSPWSFGNGEESAGTAAIAQSRAFSLADAMGASSAAYAETIKGILNSWAQDFDLFLQAMDTYGDDILKWLRKHLDDDQVGHLEATMHEVKQSRQAGETLTREVLDKILTDLALDFRATDLEEKLGALDSAGIIPRYQYWPVLDATSNRKVKPTEFADGGNLENTGIAAMLCYTDIDRIISFVNSGTALSKCIFTKGGCGLSIMGANIETEFEVDSQIPPLFGYQPYDKRKKHYAPYAGDGNPAGQQYLHNQVFDSGAFYELLEQFIATSDGGEEPILFQQQLGVRENTWFGIPQGRKDVTILWCYMVSSERFFSRLTKDVQNVLPDPFPNYSTLDTELSATRINLLSSYTAWSIADKSYRQKFLDLYRST